MELHILYLFSAPLWTLVSTIIFPTIAMIATFVCLESAKASHRRVGFFVLVPLFIAINVIVCGDAFGIFSELLPALNLYPIIGFLVSICIGTLFLCFIVLACGRSVLKSRGIILNVVSSFFCFVINTYFTYSAWKFALYTHESNLIRKDAGMIDVKDAFPILQDYSLLPDILIDIGIEIPMIVILMIFLLIYLQSLSYLKTPDEMRKDDLKRIYSKKGQKRSKEEDDALIQCCAYCEHASFVGHSGTKMLCTYYGLITSSKVCRKYVYDPLKRRAFRPQISHLDTSDYDTDDII